MYDEEPRRLTDKKMELEEEKHWFEFIGAEWLTIVRLGLDEGGFISM